MDLSPLLRDLKNRYKGTLIAVYGVGSYFDHTLPPDWIAGDIDIIAVVSSLQNIPGRDWTRVRFERGTFDDKEVWIFFNTLEGLRDKNRFGHESFSNYEWSIIELKNPFNSVHLYGKDIRDKLPEYSGLSYDYDDILRRSLYHLNTSFKAQYRDYTITKSERSITKAIFKFAFYVCVLFDPEFRLTSLHFIHKKIEELLDHSTQNHKCRLKGGLLQLFEEAVYYRRIGSFRASFPRLRAHFIRYVFTHLREGLLHTQMNHNELKGFLKDSFNGLGYLVRLLEGTSEQNRGN